MVALEAVVVGCTPVVVAIVVFVPFTGVTGTCWVVVVGATVVKMVSFLVAQYA